MWRGTTYVLWRFDVLHLQGLQALFHSQKHSTLEVDLMPMSSCLVSLEEMFLTAIKNIMDLHVSLNLIFVTIVFTSFDLWMFQGGGVCLFWLSTFSMELECPCTLLLGCLKQMKRLNFPWLYIPNIYLLKKMVCFIRWLDLM